jgi:putative ABC transport system permease protein
MMFSYYFRLGLRSLLRNRVLTALMIVAIAVGIGASMTTVTVFRIMSGDPIPWKSSKLFVPQIDNWGPDYRDDEGEPPDQLTYRDATALMQARAGYRQTALYGTAAVISPPSTNLAPFNARGRAVYADFFQMFDVPLRYGSSWHAEDDDARASVVVLSRTLNEKLFEGADSTGRVLSIDDHDYRVVGVIDDWGPQPRIYDVISEKFGEVEDVFIPFTTAVERRMRRAGNNNCNKAPAEAGWEGYLKSECVWTQFWIELPTSADHARYQTFLNNYASEQQRSGRFDWAPFTRLRDVHEWMAFKKVVTDDARMSVAIGFAFLAVCLINAVGLMLAKFSSRAGEIGVRRAVGATRRAVFTQCVVETAAIGLAGGMAGMALTALGLAGIRGVFPEEIARLAKFDVPSMAITLAVALFASVCAGIYPAWRASRAQPAWQLKAQ